MIDAPDPERHTLFIAAFGSGAVMSGVLNTGATPVWVEFSGIENSDFDPDVTYRLGGAGEAEEVRIVAWWKVTQGEKTDYQPLEPGDVWGFFPGVVFQGVSGGGGNARDVDIVLNRTFVTGSSGGLP